MAEDITVTAGSTKRVLISLTDSDGAQYSGSLVGATFRWTVKRMFSGKLTKSTADSPASLSLDQGTATLTLNLTAAETRTFDLGRVDKWDLEYISDGEEITVASGYISASGGINTDG